MDGGGRTVNLRAFAWASVRQFGKVRSWSSAVPVSAIEAPDFRAGAPDHLEEGYGRFGWLQRGGALVTDVAKMAELEDASVLRRSLGRDRWHIVLADGVCARESYHDGPWIGPHIGETVRLGTENGPVITANLMDDAPIDMRVKKPAVLVGHFWAENYAHTLLETASRFWAFDQCPDLADLPIVWDLNKPWQKEIANWLAPGRVKSLPANHVRFDTLYVPSFYSQIGSSKASVAWLRKKFGAPEGPGRKRILISRADATERRVVNENEVLDLLKPLGFEAVMLTGMTVAEQRELFRNTECVVTPHGAGCANMIFAGTGTKVIEFVPESYPHPMYWHIAKWSGHWYGRMVCPDGSNKDMRVDLATLKRAIAAAGL